MFIAVTHCTTPSKESAQGHRSSGRGGSKKVEGKGNIKNKIVTNYASSFSTMMTSKIIKETIENLFQFDLDIP